MLILAVLADLFKYIGELERHGLAQGVRVGTLEL
jgi:hypothetical protein